MLLSSSATCHNDSTCRELKPLAVNKAQEAFCAVFGICGFHLALSFPLPDRATREPCFSLSFLLLGLPVLLAKFASFRKKKKNLCLSENEICVS